MSENKNTCFLFHKWSKWETYTEKSRVYHFRAKREMNCVEVRQKRVCERCGFTQDVLVRE